MPGILLVSHYYMHSPNLTSHLFLLASSKSTSELMLRNKDLASDIERWCNPTRSAQFGSGWSVVLLKRFLSYVVGYVLLVGRKRKSERIWDHFARGIMTQNVRELIWKKYWLTEISRNLIRHLPVKVCDQTEAHSCALKRRDMWVFTQRLLGTLQLSLAGQ